MNTGIALSWVGGWIIMAAMAWLISYFSDNEIHMGWAFVGILAFDIVRWILTTMYAQALWTFFFRRHTVNGIRDALRNGRMPKFEETKDSKQYYEWIYESGPHDRDKNGNLISIEARVEAAKAQGALDGIVSAGQWLASYRIRNAHDEALRDYLNSPHYGPKSAISMDEYMEAMNPGSPLNKPPA